MTVDSFVCPLCNGVGELSKRHRVFVKRNRKRKVIVFGAKNVADFCYNCNGTGTVCGIVDPTPYATGYTKPVSYLDVGDKIRNKIWEGYVYEA